MKPGLLAPALCAACLASPGYDPLAAPSAAPRVLDLDVVDAARQRSIPLRAYLPAAAGPAPLLLFSPGLGGSREGASYLALHWAARGFAVLVMQHPGSDDGVWKPLPPERRMAALRAAASLDNFMLRTGDVPAVLNQAEAWNRSPGHPLAGRLDLSRIGMAGHSFGAITAQALGGERYAGQGALFADPRIKAVLLLSPSGPRRDSPEEAFGAVHLPWLLMTGTADDSPLGDMDAAARRVVFPALPPGSKYELVLEGAQHSSFTERPLPEERDPRYHRAVLGLSTAFWEAYLRGDAAARAWLDGQGPRSLIGARDLWSKK